MLLVFDQTSHGKPLPLAHVNSGELFSIPENSLSGASLGSVTATDPDVGATLAYSLSGAGSSNFAINSATGAITVAPGAILDFETTPAFVFSASVTDGTFNISVPVTINLTDVTENAPPTAVSLSPSTLSLAENTTIASNVFVSDITLADDGLGTSSLSLSGPDAAFFTIIGSALYLRAGTVLDFETKSSYLVTVNVDDVTLGSTPDATANFTLTLTDDTNENRPPVIGQQTFVINSKPIAGSLAGIVIASDPDAGQTLTYDIVSGNNGSAFIIEPSTGAIRVANPISLPVIPRGQTSTNVVLQVRVSDSGSPTTSSTAAITVTLSTTGRMAPTVNPAFFSIAENNKKTDGSVKVGTVKPTAAYSGQKFTFNALSGADAASFAIDAKGGITLASGVALNFETKPSYSFNVNVADSLDATKITTQSVTVSVKDINEAPVYTLVDRLSDPVAITKGAASIAIDENLPGNTIKNGFLVGTLTASDVDAGTTLALQADPKNPAADIVLDKTGAFGYSKSTGAITIIDESKISFERNKAVKLSFIVTDDPIVGDTKSKAISTKLTVTVTLNDLNEAPVFDAKSPTSFNVAENNKAGGKIGSVKAVDADKTKQTLTYSITSQVNATGGSVAIFSIDAAKGGITIPTAGALNFESSPSYTLVVRVTDSGTPTLFTEQTITVNVTDVNEASTFVLQNALNAPAASLSVSRAAINDNDKIGRLVISDVDTGTAGTYAAGSITAAVEAASKGALTYSELTGDILVKSKTLLMKTFDLKLSLKDQAGKPVTSKFAFGVNIIS